MSKEFPFHTVVFDLDGTLVDSLADVAGAVNEVLTRTGLSPLPPEQWPLLLGEGSRIRMKTAFALRGKTLTSDELDARVREFSASYADQMLVRTVLFDGALNAVRELAEIGVKIAVCTNKDEVDARRILQALGLLDYVAGVAGPDSFGVQKPNPRHILSLLEAIESDVNGAVMVGDSIHDIQAAHDAGLPAAFVAWGYGSASQSAHRPEFLVSRFDHLLEVLSKPYHRKSEIT